MRNRFVSLVVFLIMVLVFASPGVAQVYFPSGTGRSAVSRGEKGGRGIQAHTHIRSARRVWNLEASGRP